ncbi:MAG TPA: dihydropteroate synthase [Rhabdaerophilum sp.]|nr:dihydropteroate synthase [Rhabdaerophilum sp.]
MGIVNVTPDSFSDGGRFDRPDAAIAQARKLEGDGADILDIGGESTRPGHAVVSAEEETRRVVPVIAALMVENPQRIISIDTYKSSTAKAALSAGARIVNDVWGFQRDPDIAGVTAEAGAGVVLMHNRDGIDPGLDIVSDMLRFFERSLRLANEAGIPRDRISLDPGYGFGKTLEQNIDAVIGTGKIRREFGCAVLLGLSRKSSLGVITGRSVDQRLAATLAANSFGLLAGADILRVHDIAEHRDAARVVAAFAARGQNRNET